MKHRIIIVGAGKVGVALGVLLERRGYSVIAVVSRSEASLKSAGRYIPETRLIGQGRVDELARVLAEAELVFITTNDDQIEQACRMLVASKAINTLHTVIHLSGASGLSVLQSARDAGASVASIHPIQTLASIDLAIEKLPGSYFGVTAQGAALDIVGELVGALDGTVLAIEDADKPLYHAAACIVSNYLVALLDTGQLVYKAAGIEHTISSEAMLPLVQATLSNVREVGTTAALTGPIERGDISVVTRHIENLKRSCPDALDVYIALGKVTVDIALRKGSIDAAKAEKLHTFLSETLK